MATTTTLARRPIPRPPTERSPNTHPPLALPPHAASPGTWRHPKFTEIAKRQSASTFSDRNLRRAFLNALALLLSFWFSSPVHTAINTISTTLATTLTLSNNPEPITTIIPTSLTTTTTTTTTAFYTLLATRLYLFYNLISALLPTLQSKDHITDIPLTPSQRSLLGLDPSVPCCSSSASSSSAATPSTFITPPRYRFSPANATTTPDRRSISATYSPSSTNPSRFSPSPLSALSPFRNGSRTGSPFSPPPSASSPLPLHLQNAIAAKQNNNRDLASSTDRRRSLGTPSLGRSQSLRERGARASNGTELMAESPSPSPSPVPGGARRNPHLNYKWLYEKGSRLPKSETMQF